MVYGLTADFRYARAPVPPTTSEPERGDDKNVGTLRAWTASTMLRSWRQPRVTPWAHSVSR